MSEPPSGTVTFLFTDIEGSARLWEDHPEAMRAALARHDQILSDAIACNGGHVVKTTGDGLFAVFGQAEAAVTAALEAQRTLAEADWGATGALRVRMGLHTGDAEFRDGDYHGPAVNRAARLTTAGHGGQVLVSGATAALVGDRRHADAELVALGEHRLRDLGRPEVLFQLGHPDLPRRFPPLRTLDAFPGNLPLQMSSFIGREKEIAKRRPRRGARGDPHRCRRGGQDPPGPAGGGPGAAPIPGGCLAGGAGPHPRPRGGAGGVGGGLRGERPIGYDSPGVPGRVLTHQAAPGGPGQCEHLLEPVAELVEFFERHCAGLVVLATSREGLAVEGERVLPVPSLLSPPPDADSDRAGEADAVRLFVERAGAVDPDFSLTAENTRAVVKVCRRLDGVPLAIELAAARVTAMSPAELVQGLERRFETLAGGRRRAVQRHQTLRAAIDWSYDLLSEEERRLLARLAVFAGGCTRQAAEAICGTEPLIRQQVFNLLAALVAKSLVVAQRDGPETRYRLLETIREYSEERLVDNGETQALRAEHAEYFCELTVGLYDELYGADQVAVGRRLAAEHENLLAAMHHAIDTGDVDLALRLVHNTPAAAEQAGYRLLFPIDAVLRLPCVADHPLYPFGLAVAAVDAAMRGDLDRMAAASEKAVAAARHLGSDPDHRVGLLVSTARGVGAMAIGAWNEALGHQEQNIEFARSTRRPGYVAYALAGLAMVLTMTGNPDAAAPPASEGLDLARKAGAPMFIALNLVALAGALADRDPSRAHALLNEALELRETLYFQSPFDATVTQCSIIAARLADWPLVLTLGPDTIRHLHWAGDRPFLGGHLNVVARAIALTDSEAAALLQGAARRFVPIVEPERRSTEGLSVSATAPGGQAASIITELRRQTTAALKDRLGTARLHQLRAEGSAMDDDHVVACALDAIWRAGRDEGHQIHHPSAAGPNEFRLEGDVWVLDYEGRSCRLKDSKGLQYLAALLTKPGREVHVFDLMGSGVSGGGSGEALDATAKASYRRRLAELEAEEGEATEWGDAHRADRARLEAEALTAELATAYGLGGRSRSGADPTERARKAVANRIRDAVARIDSANSDLGLHLRNSVRTGTFCSYQPERPTVWNC